MWRSVQSTVCLRQFERLRIQAIVKVASLGRYVFPHTDRAAHAIRSPQALGDGPALIGSCGSSAVGADPLRRVEGN